MKRNIGRVRGKYDVREARKKEGKYAKKFRRFPPYAVISTQSSSINSFLRAKSVLQQHDGIENA